ncbi:unnamed protein product [Caenorhabditis nigoni]
MLLTTSDADRKLSYDCLKCVIQKFEVNFRFRLAKRLPKISSAEKAAPLYISTLSISEGSFHLNDVTYRLGVIQQAREGPTPKIIETLNQLGGSWVDIDRFGIEKRSLPELTPGDILIQDYDPELNDNLERAEARLATEQRRLADLERYKMEIENEPDYLVEPGSLDRGRRIRRKRMIQILDKYNTKIGETKLNVQRFQCKRDNLPWPYDMFIQLTRKSPDGTVYIERFNYDKSLKEAQKYLISKLLGNRRVVTKIKSLSFWPFLNDKGLVIGLPDGVKFDVQEFGTCGKLSEVLQRVETILEYPNRPFARLASDSLRLEDVQDPRVRQAEVLELTQNFRVNVMAFYREVTNKKVVITLTNGIFPDQYARIVENLIDTKATLGTCYEFDRLRDKDKVSNALRVIAERFVNAVVGERFVTIPLPNQLQLDVSYAPYQLNSGTRVYTIKVEVVRNRSN